MKFGTYFFQFFFIIPPLLSCEGKTPEDFDREFNQKYNACFERAKLKCDSATIPDKQMHHLNSLPSTSKLVLIINRLDLT